LDIALLPKNLVLLAPPRQLLVQVVMRTGKKIGFPKLLLPPRQRRSTDPKIVGYFE